MTLTVLNVLSYTITNIVTLEEIAYGIQIDDQPDAIIFLFIILTFIYSSTCFGRSPAHHQELNDCSSSLWFYFRIVVIVVLLVLVGPAGPTTTNSTTITTVRR